MVWQQKQREEHQNHKAIPDGERSNKSTMRKPGIPPARIPEITWRKPSRHNSSYSHFEAKNDKAVSQREWSNIFFSKKVFFVFSIAADLALRLDQWEKRLNRVQKEKKQNQPKQNKQTKTTNKTNPKIAAVTFFAKIGAALTNSSAFASATERHDPGEHGCWLKVSSPAQPGAKELPIFANMLFGIVWVLLSWAFPAWRGRDAFSALVGCLFLRLPWQWIVLSGFGIALCSVLFWSLDALFAPRLTLQTRFGLCVVWSSVSDWRIIVYI